MIANGRATRCPISTSPKLQEETPLGWKWVRLGEVARLESGHTPSRRNPSYWEDGNVPWLSLKDIKGLSSAYVVETTDTPTMHGINNSSARLLPKDTVAFCRTASVGKVVILGREMATSQDFVNWVCSEQISPKYLYWALKSSAEEFNKEKQGATHKTIYVPAVKRFQVLLPPLSEQKRIAEILDRAEALRAKRRAALALLDELTQSIFLDMFGDPATNSKRLPTIELGELGKWASGGTPPRGREDYFVGSIPWFSSGELNEMFVTESKEHISESALAETSAKRIKTGSLMLGMYDTAALKTSISALDCSCNQAIAYASIDEQVAETLFVYYAIKIGREHFRRLQRGVRQKNLNLTMIRQITIPNPPLSLQTEFVNRAMKVEAICKIHRDAERELNQLFASLQHRAFRGEL